MFQKALIAQKETSIAVLRKEHHIGDVFEETVKSASELVRRDARIE